ncbi:hypothetical protein OEA41_000583 [Lepraria neglecta]|uniref:Uncharacterized protein n=1 Tax=Lepraria neglecta TaxID=209136 RepID=A0AAD9ZII7_9LECA|nr:hypothetical protein OEA41_000583 [Lepraria neglecta]
MPPPTTFPPNPKPQSRRIQDTDSIDTSSSGSSRKSSLSSQISDDSSKSLSSVPSTLPPSDSSNRSSILPEPHQKTHEQSSKYDPVLETLVRSSLRGNRLDYTDPVKFKPEDNQRKYFEGLVPRGWSNDPTELAKLDRKFLAESYGLHPSWTYVDPTLVRTNKAGTNKAETIYLIEFGTRYFFWYAQQKKLLFITQPYSLAGVIWCLTQDKSKTPRMRTVKPFPPKNVQDPEPISSNLVPKGWSNDPKVLLSNQRYISFEHYGLYSPVPYLTSNCADGVNADFFQCDSQHYVYDATSYTLCRIEEPTNKDDIGHALIKYHLRGIKDTELEEMPEYGGRYEIPENEVPKGWSKTTSPDEADGIPWRKVDLDPPTCYLYNDGRADGEPRYLVKSSDEYYLWYPRSNMVRQVVEWRGLQQIIETLNDPHNQRGLITTLRPPQSGRWTNRQGR